MVQLSCSDITTVKTIALTIWTFAGNVMSLLFNTLSMSAIAFLPRTKYLLILWVQSLSVVILEPKKIKSVTVSTFSPSVCHKVVGPDTMILVFWKLSFRPAFSRFSFTFIKKLFSSSFLSAIRVVSSACLRLLILLVMELEEIEYYIHKSRNFPFIEIWGRTYRDLDFTGAWCLGRTGRVCVRQEVPWLLGFSQSCVVHTVMITCCFS